MVIQVRLFPNGSTEAALMPWRPWGPANLMTVVAANPTNAATPDTQGRLPDTQDRKPNPRPNIPLPVFVGHWLGGQAVCDTYGEDP